MADDKDKSVETEEEKKPVTAADMPSRVTVKLTRPISTKDGEVKELTFREPTGNDIEQHGNPVDVWWDNRQERFRTSVDEKRMTLMLAALSENTDREIKQLSGKDRVACSYAVERFFYPDFARISS